MKMWEVIKELTRDKTKTFRKEIPCGDYVVAKASKWAETQFKLKVTRYIGDGSEDEICMNVILGLDDDWTEVEEPVDFITAYQDCKENGNTYKAVDTRNVQGTNRQIMDRRSNSVRVYDKEIDEVWLDCMWIKQ